jgi:hypothetical protein
MVRPEQRMGESAQEPRGDIAAAMGERRSDAGGQCERDQDNRNDAASRPIRPVEA